MPNWCENELKVRGTKEDLEKFLNYGGNSKFTFGKYIPMPETYEKFDTTNKMLNRNNLDYSTKKPIFNSDEEYETYKKGYEDAVNYQRETYGVVGWYEWRLENYGTRGDVNDVEMVTEHISDDYESITMHFDTAWSPCINFVRNVSKMFPDLEFELTYIETGNFFCGIYTSYFSDGEQYEDNEEGEPILVRIDNWQEITEDEAHELESENGTDEWDGFGTLYDYVNPYQQ